MSVDITNRMIEVKDQQKHQKNILASLDTRAKLKKHQETKIRDYYSKVFKNENSSLAKQGITIRSSIGTLSKTRKKQGFKVQANKLTLKAAAEKITTSQVSITDTNIQLG
jgi:type II secretory pathway component PulF